VVAKARKEMDWCPGDDEDRRKARIDYFFYCSREQCCHGIVHVNSNFFVDLGED